MKKQTSQQQEELSPAVKFLDAFVAAMPRTTGDRAYSSAIHEAMVLAVRNRFQFKIDDAAELSRFYHSTCVGVFRPLDMSFYSLACKVGGTYARMWEKHNGMKPWVAQRTLGRVTHHDYWDEFENTRVAPGMAVLVPVAVENDEPELARLRGDQVWWCTSISDEYILLCRYRSYYAPKDPHPNPYRTEGAPVRKRKITRAEWDAFQGQTAASPATEQAAA